MYSKRLCVVAAAAVAFTVVHAGPVLAAGNVTAQFGDYALEIVGDQADNEIALYSDEFGTVWLEGCKDTTINGSTEPFSFVPAAFADIDIDMQEGDNAVDVRPHAEWMGGLWIRTAEGDDKVVVKGGGLPVIVKTDGGNDEVLIEDVVTYKVYVDTGDGRDKVVLRNTDTADYGAYVGTTVETWWGHDTIVIDSILTANLSIYAGEGNDLVELRGNSMLTYNGSIGLGDGNDTLHTEGSEGASFLLDGPLGIAGQKGHDTLVNHDYFQILPPDPPAWWLTIDGFEKFDD